MPATLEQLEPSANGAGKIGLSDRRWGEGHFAALYVNGAAVAPLASPIFTGTPAAPTAAPGTNTTQLASTAFVTAADVIAKARANHTGTQLASTISNFDAAVTASTAGAKAHVAGTDTGLSTGTGNAVTAIELRTHLDDATKHRIINDSATSSTSLWSSSKVEAAISAAVGGTVTTSGIANGAVTGAKVQGGTSAPGNNKYWGTDGLGAFGFHTMSSAVKVSLSAGEGELSATGGLHVTLGTTSTRAASGADTRFPTAGEKSALAGQTGTPSGSNKYLTKDWAEADVFLDAAITTGTSTTPGRVTPAQMKLAAETFGGGGGGGGSATWTIERAYHDGVSVVGSTKHFWIAPVAGTVTRLMGEVAVVGNGALNFALLKNGSNVTSATVSAVSTPTGGGNRRYGSVSGSFAVAAGDVLEIISGDGASGSTAAVPAVGPLVVGLVFTPS